MASYVVALLVGLHMVGGVSAGAAEIVEDEGVGVSIVPGVTSPLTGLSIAAGQLTCVQSALAVNAEGEVGVLAPQIGATVVRGSTSAGPAVTWLVVRRDLVGDEAVGLTTVCMPSQ